MPPLPITPPKLVAPPLLVAPPVPVGAPLLFAAPTPVTPPEVAEPPLPGRVPLPPFAGAAPAFDAGLEHPSKTAADATTSEKTALERAARNVKLISLL
jgi:hypothetical protein